MSGFKEPSGGRGFSVEEVKQLLLEYMRDVASMCRVIESTARSPDDVIMDVIMILGLEQKLGDPCRRLTYELNERDAKVAHLTWYIVRYYIAAVCDERGHYIALIGTVPTQAYYALVNALERIRPITRGEG